MRTDIRLLFIYTTEFVRLERTSVINLEKSISETDERAAVHVVLPGDDGYDSMIDRVETCCSAQSTCQNQII